MKPVRTLGLRREVLAELTADQLRGVAGAAATLLAICPVTQVGVCEASNAHTCIDCLTRGC